MSESRPPVLLATIFRELRLAVRRPVEVLNPLLFFVIAVALFPLGLGPDPQRLADFAPGVLWIVALLASMMAAENMFRGDYEDGSIEQLILSPHSLYFILLSRMLAAWMLAGFPLALLGPVLGGMLNLPTTSLPALFTSLLLGTGVLTLLSGIGAALTVGLHRGGVLLSLLVLPLYVPVLIFGSGAVQAAADGGEWMLHIAILASLLCLALALAPLAMSAGLRISLDN